MNVKLTLGTIKIIYCDEIISNKEKNIHTFKSSFGEELFSHYYLGKDNLELIDLILK